MTSYRREGLIVRDAMLDIDHLREYVVKQFGTPKYVILEVRFAILFCLFVCLLVFVQRAVK